MLKTIVLSPRSLQRYKPQPWTAAHDPRKISCRRLSSGNNLNTNDGLAEVFRNRIRGWSEQAAGSVRKHADSFTVAANTAISHFGSQLNRMTGYEEIEALKKRVEEQEARMHAGRDAARLAKAAYEAAIVERSKSQREVNDLLQRKSTWTDHDVGRFTALVREDHTKEQEEAHAKAMVSETEDAVDRQFSELMRSILARYHEEQIWSDKIRSASTYGSLMVLALNLLVFVVAITVVEPWKRRRLAEALEKQIEEMGERNAAMVDAGLREIERRLEEQRGVFDEGVQNVLETLLLLVHRNNALPEDGTAKDVVGGETQAGAAQGKDRDSGSKRDVGLAAAVGAITSGIIGWMIHSWFGT